MTEQPSPSQWTASLGEDEVIDVTLHPHLDDDAAPEPFHVVRSDEEDPEIPTEAEIPIEDESVFSEATRDGDELTDEPDPLDNDLPEVDEFEDHWVTVAEAAQLLGQSETTVRRKLKSGELNGEMAFDQSIGARRWMVDAADLEADRPDTTTLVPMAAIDRLEKAWGDTRDAVARAETAERIANFERERRIEAEGERDRLRSLLTAENDLAQRIAELEKNRRIQAEKERDRLRALLEVEPKNTWWMTMKERFRL